MPTPRTSLPHYLPSYGGAIRRFVYSHRLPGYMKNNHASLRVPKKPEEERKGHKEPYYTSNNYRRQRHISSNLQDLIRCRKTNKFYSAPRTGSMYLPLVDHMHPLYPELGYQFWFIDANEGLERARNKGLICVFDLIHLLCFRKPPPGPFFFMPDNVTWFEQLKEFYAVYDFEAPPSRQYQTVIPGQREVRDFISMFHDREPQLLRTCLSDVWWFNPHNPYITWVPETCRWRLYYYEPKSKKHVNTTYSAWNYWKAQERLIDFVKDTTGLEFFEMSPELQSACDYTRFVRRTTEENRPNRFWYNFSMHKPRDQLVMGEHPRDPYWDQAYKEKLILLRPYHSPNEEFVHTLQESLR